jgi:hypothetical protein
MYYSELREMSHAEAYKRPLTGIDYTRYYADGRAKTGRPRKSDYASETVRVFAKRGKQLAKQAREVKKASYQRLTDKDRLMILAFLLIGLLLEGISR